MVGGGGVAGGEWTVRHTAVDFELLSSFAELSLCACKCVHTYVELALKFHTRELGEKTCTVS